MSGFAVDGGGCIPELERSDCAACVASRERGPASRGAPAKATQAFSHWVSMRSQLIRARSPKHTIYAEGTQRTGV